MFVVKLSAVFPSIVIVLTSASGRTGIPSSSSFGRTIPPLKNKDEGIVLGKDEEDGIPVLPEIDDVEEDGIPVNIFSSPYHLYNRILVIFY